MTNATATYRRSLGDTKSTLDAVPRVALTPAQAKLVQDALRDMMVGYPFLASVSSSDSVRYHAVQTDQFPVAATDGIGVYFNISKDGFFDTARWNADHRVFAMGHEIAHVVREDTLYQHMCSLVGFVTVPRTPTCPDGRLPFDKKIMGRSLDAIINSGLIADKVGAPLPGIVTHPAITATTSNGEAYAIMWQENQKQGGGGGQPPQNPQPGQNKGQPQDPLSGDIRQPGSMGDPYGDSSDEASQPQDAQGAAKQLQDTAPERSVAVERAVNAARMAGQGTSAMEAMTAKAREPGVDWRSYIQGFLARCAGNSAWDFRRPLRAPFARPLVGEQAYFAPARGGNGCNHVVFVGDTSGSIGENEHRAMLAALVEMLGELRPRVFTVVWCDSAVQRIDTFPGCPDADEVDSFYTKNRIPRGGGTSFIPPFEMIDSIMAGGSKGVPSNSEFTIPDLLEGGKPDGLVYFTDLYGEAPGAKPDYPVLWAAITDEAHPWGERVNINVDSLVK